MNDPFLQLGSSQRLSRAPASSAGLRGAGHGERKHSKFAASAAERWFNCSASVELSEGLPDKDSVWSIEGTHAHEVLENILLERLGLPLNKLDFRPTPQMLTLGHEAADFIWSLHRKNPGSDILVETRILLDFIHPEMFGTFDGAVIAYFDTLHVFDYKYGAGTFVTPKENLQMIFYCIGLAYLHHWNFKRVRAWIIQPRVKGYDGPLFWDISIQELRGYVARFQEAVDRVLTKPVLVEGPWCHWCRAKTAKCPLKQEKKMEKAKEIFTAAPLPF